MSWNGKEKEFNSNKYLTFDGEYINGKRNGKVIRYFMDNNIYIEGEYLIQNLKSQMEKGTWKNIIKIL